MSRIPAILVAIAFSVPVRGQQAAEYGGQALSFSRDMSFPLNAVQLHDRAAEAWTWTFGREPGAAMRRNDREAGILEGQARMNFRSEMLTLREETMGTVAYRVVVRTKAGECRVMVTELVHTGNRSAHRGGVHVGTLTTGELPAQRVQGMGRTTTARVHAELKLLATQRINQLLQTFEARIRAGIEP